MHAIGRDDLGQDPLLANNKGRVTRTDDIDGAIGEWAASHELADILVILNAADVPHGKIYTAADIVNDPQYLARAMIQQMTDRAHPAERIRIACLMCLHTAVCCVSLVYLADSKFQVSFDPATFHIFYDSARLPIAAAVVGLAAVGLTVWMMMILTDALNS